MESARSMIREGFEKIHKIVKALMTFSKSDVEKPVESDLHEIIDNTLLIVNSRFGDQIRIEKDYRLEHTVPVFQDKLHQILLNIIDNAIFAIQREEEEKEKKDFIRICTWEVKGRTAGERQAVIEICNYGSGYSGSAYF